MTIITPASLELTGTGQPLLTAAIGCGVLLAGAFVGLGAVTVDWLNARQRAARQA